MEKAPSVSSRDNFPVNRKPLGSSRIAIDDYTIMEETHQVLPNYWAIRDKEDEVNPLGKVRDDYTN